MARRLLILSIVFLPWFRACGSQPPKYPDTIRVENTMEDRPFDVLPTGRPKSASALRRT